MKVLVTGPSPPKEQPMLSTIELSTLVSYINTTLKNVYRYFAHFKLGYFFLFLGSLYVLVRNHFSDGWFKNISFHSLDCPLTTEFALNGTKTFILMQLLLSGFILSAVVQCYI